MIRTLSEEEMKAQEFYSFTEKVPRERIDCIPQEKVLSWILSKGWTKGTDYHLANIYKLGEDVYGPRIYVFHEQTPDMRRASTRHAIQALMDIYGMSLQQLLDQINAQ